MEEFDAYSYFGSIHRSLKDLEGFHFCRVTGKESMEEMMDNARAGKAFFCVDDTEDGVIIEKSGGYFTRRLYFVWILKKYNSRGQDNMGKQIETMKCCRQIYKDVVSRILKDRDTQEYGLTYAENRFPFWEIPMMLFPEVTGVYFSLTVDTPEDLTVKPDKWK